MRLRAVIAIGALGVAAGVLWLDRREPSETAVGAIVPDSIVLLGDSITAQGDWSTLIPGRPVVNAGYSGLTTAQLVDVAARVAVGGPQLVYVLAGTNDIRDDLPASRTASDYRRLVDVLATSPETEIVVQTVLPRADRPVDVDRINQELKALAAERGLRVLDLHTAFDDGQGGLRDAETTDGVHLSADGYERWAAILVADLEQARTG